MDQPLVRILLVEDNLGDARLLREFLSEDRSLKCEMQHKDRLQAALGALAAQPVNEPFDVVLLDLSLPDMQGIETLIKMHEVAPRLPIIVLTGLNDENTAVQAVQKGAQDYLVKGQVDGPNLGRAIRYSIERSKADAMQRQLLTERAARSEAEVGEKRFRGLAESIPQIVWELEPEGNIVYLSARWFEYTGQAQGTVEPIDQNEFIHPADTIALMETWTLAKKNHTVWQYEYRLRRADGVYRWHLARSVPSFDASGQLVKWYGTATDIDDQKRVEEERGRLYEQARLAIKSRDDLLATVSHDLRSPLSSIVMSASMISPAEGSPLLDPTKIARFAGMIGRAARRMDHLIRDLLDIASIESGHLSINPARITVGQLVADAMDALVPVAQEKQQHIESHVSDSEAAIHCDRNRILQVFTNIVGNATKFSPAGSTIVLKAGRHDGQVEFSITDRGPGIAADQLRHVFERFWQAKETAKAGTGLGLAICRGIIEQHHGKIWVESTIGQGTTFSFSLPVDESA